MDVEWFLIDRNKYFSYVVSRKNEGYINFSTLTKATSRPKDDIIIHLYGGWIQQKGKEKTNDQC